MSGSVEESWVLVCRAGGTPCLVLLSVAIASEAVMRFAGTGAQDG